jgi:hypothetical protein
MSKEEMKEKSQQVTIAAPKFQIAEFIIRGNAPYVQNKFGAKARQKMKDQQEKGSTGKKGAKREPKDFQALYLEATHKATEDWYGIPAPAFRNAMISACRVCGFQMTKAKLSFFALADGFDADDGTPLVRISKGAPHYSEMAVRNETGVADIRPRPMWDLGWEAVLRIRFDADMFTVTDIANLVMRAGLQVGVGEGRPDSKKSAGLDWGTFDIINEQEIAA